MTDKDKAADEKPQTPQSESIPGPTYAHPQGQNDPKTDEEAGAPTGNPSTDDK